MAKYKIIPSSRTIVQSPISIGHKAEKGVEAIEFDLTAWVETYGSGTLTVIMRRWGDAIPYPIALEIDENNKATWTLSDTDTAKAGMAYAQLSYVVGETVVKKSDIYTFRVMDSLTGEGDPPEAYESWLEHLTHLAAEAMAEVLDIEGIVTDKTLTVDGGIADAKATGDALALKADKSTTYTKTEVDQMVEDVEVETDTTLEIAGAPADAAETGRQIGLIKADLDAIVPGLSNEAKAALLACFEHVAWIDDDGQDYYDVLAAALNQDSIRFVMVNNSAYGLVNSTQGDKYYVPSTASACARFNPVKNKNNVIAVTDSDKYNLASYEVTNDTLIAFAAWMSTELVTREGYYAYNQEANPSWAQAAVVEAPYFTCSFKKMNGTDFTTDEIDNAEGTIFVIGKSSDIVKWNGMDTGGITQKWIDKDQIIGITNPKKYALVSGYGVTGYHESNGGKVQISAKRATSLSQVIVGDFDGKTIGLSNYTLSTGAQIAYGIWYGYINPNNNSYNGTNYISDGTDNVYVFGKWNTENIILPVDSAKVGKRVVLLAFKITNADREFTQAELREIPTLIQIS